MNECTSYEGMYFMWMYFIWVTNVLYMNECTLYELMYLMWMYFTLVTNVFLLQLISSWGWPKLDKTCSSLPNKLFFFLKYSWKSAPCRRNASVQVLDCSYEIKQRSWKTVYHKDEHKARRSYLQDTLYWRALDIKYKLCGILGRGTNINYLKLRTKHVAGRWVDESSGAVNSHRADTQCR